MELIYSLFSYIFIGFVIYTIVKSAKKRNRIQDNESYQPSLSRRETIVLDLVNNQNIYDVIVIQRRISASELEANRIINKLISNGYLSNYFLNYRTKKLEKVVKTSPTIDTIPTPTQFQSKYVKCESCGANGFMSSTHSKCQYCGSPLYNPYNKNN